MRSRMSWKGLFVIALLLLGACTPPAPAATPPAATPGAGGDQLSVTLNDNGKTINLKPGERFLLNLGEGYDWSVTVGDEQVVSRVIGITVIRGAQGIYEAHQAGQTTLQAAGDPACRKNQPPCAAPSKEFSVTLVVK